MFRIFLFIFAYFYFLVLKDLIITNRDDENVIGVIVINKLILYFFT